MFLIVGSDERLKYTAISLINSGYGVSVYANDSVAQVPGVSTFDNLSDAVENNSCIVFGIPFSRDNLTVYAPLSDKKIFLDDVLKFIDTRHIVVGGKLEDFSLNVLKNGARCVDYAMREDFSLYNADITAEAVVSVIMNKLPVTISGLNCLVMGYGRIGKSLARKMKCLGANVSVTARKSSDLALADIMGFKSQKTSDIINDADSFRVVVNTIPCKVMTEKTFERLNKDCLVVDASAYPGFVDVDIASNYGIDTESAFSMPGKYAPVSAGRIIADVILNICKETDVLKET